MMWTSISLDMSEDLPPAVEQLSSQVCNYVKTRVSMRTFVLMFAPTLHDRFVAVLSNSAFRHLQRATGPLTAMPESWRLPLDERSVRRSDRGAHFVTALNSPQPKVSDADAHRDSPAQRTL